MAPGEAGRLGAATRPGSAAVDLPAVAAGEPPLTWTRWARYWTVVVAWMALVSYLSTDAFSAENTNRYLDPFLRWLLPGVTNPELVLAHTVIRKAAHFTEFCILGVLVFWAFRGGRSQWSRVWVLKALLVSVAYAALDETHQMFTANRTPSLADCGIDALGAAAGQVMLYLGHHFRRSGA